MRSVIQIISLYFLILPITQGQDSCNIRIGTDTITSCLGEGTFYLDNPISEGGDYLILTSDRGGSCDTFLELHVIELFPENDTILQAVAEGESFTFLNNTFDEFGTYSVRGVGNNGCQKTTTIILEPITRFTLRLNVSNAFSPNGDNVNDTWQITVPTDFEFTLISVDIYNRWGGKVFHASSLEASWTGTTSSVEEPNGTYFYSAEFADPQGGRHYLQGDITLIR